MTKGYKATYNYQCKTQIYEIGQEYKIDQIPILCQRGFHYCLDAKHTLYYYPVNPNFKLLEIEDLNTIETVTDRHKLCSNHIRIVREITDPEELIQLLGFVRTFNELEQELIYKDSDGYWRERTYNKNGQELSCKVSSGYWYEFTYNENGQELTSKNSSGYSTEYTYDKNGNELTYKTSDGFWREYTYDENGNELTYKDSDQLSYDGSGQGIKLQTLLNCTIIDN